MNEEIKKYCMVVRNGEIN